MSPSPSLDALFNEYLGFCRAKRISRETLRWYDSKLGYLIQALKRQGVKTLADLSVQSIQSVVAALDTGERSSYTLKGYVQALRGFLHYLEEEELVDPRLRRRTPLPKVAKRLIKTYSEETFTALYDAARYESTPWLRQRDRAILMLLLDTGIRARELCELTRDGLVLDHPFDDPYIRVIGKGDKEREVGPLSPGCLRDLRRYLRVQPTTDTLFLNRYHQPLTPSGLDQMLYRLRDFAGLGDEGVEVRAHIFRHSYATRRLAEGMDIKRLSLLLGHSSVSTTETYLRDYTSRQARQFQAPQQPRLRRNTNRRMT